MTASLCDIEPAPISAEKRRANQRELWRRYSRSGPGSALENTMVEEYLPLVRTVVGRLAMTLPSHVNSDDLHSAGLVGLLNALRRYNPDCGTSFETYARVRIRGAVFDELRRMDWVPRSVHEKAKRIEKTMQELTQRHGGLPTDQAMAKALNMSLDDYEALLEEIRPTTYLCLDSVQGPDGEHGSGFVKRRKEQRDDHAFVHALRADLYDLIAGNDLHRHVAQHLAQEQPKLLGLELAEVVLVCEVGLREPVVPRK